MKTKLLESKTTYKDGFFLKVTLSRINQTGIGTQDWNLFC